MGQFLNQDSSYTLEKALTFKNPVLRGNVLSKYQNSLPYALGFADPFLVFKQGKAPLIPSQRPQQWQGLGVVVDSVSISPFTLLEARLLYSVCF